MVTLIKLSCVSFLLAALSYVAFVITDGRGAWPSDPKYFVVLGMYGFTILGGTLLVAACLAKLVSTFRSANITGERETSQR